MAGTAELRAALPAALAEPLTGWEEHLRLQRDLSEHTVRGYVGDVVSLLDHLVRRGGGTVADLAAGLSPYSDFKKQLLGACVGLPLMWVAARSSQPQRRPRHRAAQRRAPRLDVPTWPHAAGTRWSLGKHSS